MANILKMAKIQSIRQLHSAGRSQRRIARELELDRGTVARYLQTSPPHPKPAIPPTGSSGANAATFLPSPGRLSQESGSRRLQRQFIAVIETCKTVAVDTQSRYGI
jgi:hypothetical protein